MSDASDNLSEPLLKMAKFYLGDVCLPRVSTVKDVFEYGKALNERGTKVLESEERFLRQVTWCMLQIQNDHEEGELHQALTRIAALTLAIMEDPEFSIPEGYAIGGRQNLETLALRFHQEWSQTDLSLGAAMGIHDLSFRDSAGLAATARALEGNADEPLRQALHQGVVFLRQGEEGFARHTDPTRRDAHAARIEAALERLRLLIARLLATPPDRDHPVLRQQLVRRELKHVEIDSLGAKRISEAEQARETRRLLRWTEADLGEELTDENKAELAAQLREIAERESDVDADEQDASDEDWLFGMD